MIGAPAAINATLYGKLNFDFIRDIAPVAGVARFSNVLVVNPSVPAYTIPGFIAHARANPGKINMASTGIGSTPHVTGELFKMMVGVNWCTCRIAARQPRPPICSVEWCRSISVLRRI